MSKHVLDHDRPVAETRTERFAEIERQTSPEGSHPASQELHRRPQTRSDAGTQHFLKIARGRRA